MALDVFFREDLERATLSQTIMAVRLVQAQAEIHNQPINMDVLRGIFILAQAQANLYGFGWGALLAETKAQTGIDELESLSMPILPAG